MLILLLLYFLLELDIVFEWLIEYPSRINRNLNSHGLPFNVTIVHSNLFHPSLLEFYLIGQKLLCCKELPFILALWTFFFLCTPKFLSLCFLVALPPKQKNWSLYSLALTDYRILSAGAQDNGNWRFQLAEGLFCASKIRCFCGWFQKMIKQVCWWSSWLEGQLQWNSSPNSS
jgi:hypothetical protein